MTTVTPKVLDAVKQNEPVEYETTFKKGHMVNKFRFKFAGSISEAIEKAKEFCLKRSIKHLHTVPFYLNLDTEGEWEDFGTW